MEFIPVEPAVRTKSGGKQAAPNPYADAVKGIALKTNEKTGKPLALAFPLPHADAESVVKDRARVERQLVNAGLALDPPVTVRRDFAEANVVTGTGKDKKTAYASMVTFWTIPKIDKPSVKK